MKASMNYHATVKPISDTSVFLRSIVGFAIAAMVVVGIGGSVYKLLAPGGWLAQLFGRSVAGGLGAVLALLVIGLCFWLTRGWFSFSSHSNRYAELPVYLFAGMGLIYSVQMLMAR